MQYGIREYRLIIASAIWLAASAFRSIQASPLSKSLRSFTEPTLVLSINNTIAATQRPTDPYEYRLPGVPIMVKYFDFEEGRYGVIFYLEQAVLDFRRRLSADPALRNTLMGTTERCFVGDLQSAGSSLFLHPSEDMTWNHWLATPPNMHNVVGGLRENLNGAGFYFKINVDGIGQVGSGNFTQNEFLARPGLVSLSK